MPPTSSHMISHSSSTSFPTTEKKERKNRETDLEKQEVVVEHTVSRPSSITCLMVELSWPVPEVTWEHLQNLVSKGYMTVVEFATCLVPEDPTSPAPVRGYVMVCVAFFEREFGVPLHQFLRSLLQSYGLELHHVTPSGILHMAAFVTLCEAYIETEPHLNLCSHFFWAQLQ
jgi:hypothetical protein